MKTNNKMAHLAIKVLTLSGALLGVPPAMAQATHWQGLFGQVGVGYQQHQMKTTSGTRSTTGGDYFFTGDSSSTNSFGLNLSGGYSLALSDSFLLGLGVDYSPLSTPYADFQAYYPERDVTARGKWRILNSYSIFITPGWAIDDSKLAYAKLGYAAAQKQTTVKTYNMSGWTVGLGYKQFIHKQLYAFGELNYADYGNIANRPGFSGSSKVTAFNVLLGLGYKF